MWRGALLSHDGHRARARGAEVAIVMNIVLSPQFSSPLHWPYLHPVGEAPGSTDASSDRPGLWGWHTGGTDNWDAWFAWISAGSRVTCSGLRLSPAFVHFQAALTCLSPSAHSVWGVEVETSTREMWPPPSGANPPGHLKNQVVLVGSVWDPWKGSGPRPASSSPRGSHGTPQGPCGQDSLVALGLP